MNWLSKIWNFIKNPKNKRLLVFAAIFILGLLFFKQCNNIKALKEQIKTEQADKQRIQNNYDASQDTVRMFKTENGNLRGEISGYTLTLEELNGKYANLFSEYQKEKNKPPKTIIEYVIQIKEVIKEVPVYVSIDSLGNTAFVFSDTAVYEDNNMRMLTGLIPFELKYFNKKDSVLLHPDNLNLFGGVYPGKGQFELKQNISLVTGLSIDKTTKKPLIWVETKYPGVTFPTITGAYIMDDPISRANAKKLRKEFGISAQFGYGLLLSKTSYNTGLYMGVGISYTPRWLQFGK